MIGAELINSLRAKENDGRFELISSEAELTGKIRLNWRKILNSSIGILLTLVTCYYLNYTFSAIQPIGPYLLVVTSFLLLFFLRNLVSDWSDLSVYREIRQESKSRYHEYSEIIVTSNIQQFEILIRKIKSCLAGKICSFLRSQYSQYLNNLTVRLEKLEHENNLRELKQCCKDIQSVNAQKIEHSSKLHPVLVVKAQLKEGLDLLETRKDELQNQWDAAYEKFSWWQKLKYATGPDFRELNEKISELKRLNTKFIAKHDKDVSRIQREYAEALRRSAKRINDSYEFAYKIIQENRNTCPSANELLQKAFLCSAFAVPASLWGDFNRADDIYDSLRKVNQNFQGMSDSEIWWETLWMPSVSLNGLESLTKGAYFEQLVADDTGGKLFEHFNHKDTDIIIDGMEMQLKATDSISYIENVDKDILVVATSEVAGKTNAIDSGYSNEELTDSVDLALGGTVVDIADTTVDTILAGLGGLGLFATIRGINHAAKKYNNGGDGVEAVFEGAGVAIEGTAKGLIDASELVFNVATSRPCRFVGRHIYAGLEKLDKKLFGG